MAHSFTRRTFLHMAGAATALTAVPAFGQERRLRAFWWGGQDRLKRTQQAIADFVAQNPGLTVDSESVGFDDYITRVSTQIAGGNGPDLFQMDYRYISEYAQRGALEPLDDYVGELLDLSDWPAPTVDSLRVDGKLYGVNLGNNTNALFFDKEAYGKVGITEIPIGTTWEQFLDMALQVTKAHDGKYFGCNDPSGKAAAFDNYMRQKEFASYDGQSIGTPVDAVTEWFEMWAKARADGASPPADVAALDKDTVDANLITQGYAGAAFVHSNGLVGYQKTTPKPLGITAYPQGAGPKNGQYLKPSNFWSIYSGSKLKEDAIKLANYTVMNPEGVKVLGLERGVPCSPRMQEVVAPTLDEVNKASLDFVIEATKVVSPIPPPPPRGATEVEALLREVSQQVAFEQMTPKEGAQRYVDEGNAILERA
ncbi:extracellular solute-binding protein [Chelativorans sp.]|uniref:ABC transporter substrate-binding protein n=1 Tax=Chelativorans sp. TaxID=2203393 RepID=UPI0028117B31|nr:extracellular solute-binding protein [Chelativorans sp.]